MQKKALLLIGSPKKDGSVSEKICSYFLNLLKTSGLSVEKMHIMDSFKSQESRDNLMRCVNESDLIVFSCPLYVDSMPYMVIKAMEFINERMNKTKGAVKKGLIAILHCGFPEANQNCVAIDIYRRFAVESGFEWLGGMAFGMAPVMNLDFLNNITYNVRKALKIAANAVAKERSLPQECAELAAKPFMPIWLYVLIGDIAWLFLILKNRAWGINSRPYISQN